MEVDTKADDTGPVSEDKSEKSNDENIPAALKILFNECRRLYPSQPNPLQVTTLVKYWLVSIVTTLVKYWLVSIKLPLLPTMLTTMLAAWLKNHAGFYQ